jgi:hypothetical protein
MARIRSVKPGFCKSEAINELSMEAELHFIKLWTYADDEGRGLDNPKLIKGECWPLRDQVKPATVEAYQAELARKGRIVRYSECGKRYFQVVNWLEHQKPQHPKPSEYPTPPEQDRSNPEMPHENGSTPHEGSPENAPVVVVGEVVGEGEGVGAAPMALVLVSPEDPPEPSFEDFWTVYPRKRDKGHAKTAWERAVKKASASVIYFAAERLAASRGDPQFIPYPATWLNGEGWLDEPEQPHRSLPKAAPSIMSYADEYGIRL